MARRLHQTMADYVVIAISPALIMTLVGSLVFFLLAVFYRASSRSGCTGSWLASCSRAVLIGRISIEEGFERAAPFGIALAIVVGMAANSFMEFHGRWIDSFGWADQLGTDRAGLVVRPSTDVGLHRDRRLARRLGRGPAASRGTGAAPTTNPSIRPATPTCWKAPPSRHVPSGWWQRYVEHQRRPHAPGVWVVYFSLAALPLFGIGQWFIPASDTGRPPVRLLAAVHLRRPAAWACC